MDIETVIAIAKELMPGFVRARMTCWFDGFINVELIYKSTDTTLGGVWRGNSWEEALRNAGWKG